MRLALLTAEFPDSAGMGGIGTNTATLAAALAGRGHDVVVLRSGDADRRTTEGGVVVRTVARPRLPDRRAEALLLRRRLATAAAGAGAEVIHAAEYGALAWWAARWSALPVVTRLATPTYLVEQLNRDGGRPEAVRAWMERDQARHSAVVYAPTRSIADAVGPAWGLDGGQVDLVSNAIDLAAVRRAGAGDPGVALPERYVVLSGRLERRKGIDTLGRALPEILGARPDLHAVVVGRDPGDEAGAVTAEFHRNVASVADRVHLLGELPRDAALAVVARSRLAVIPSVWESFGYVCVEALALGRPVVASRAGGLAEIVEDGVSGRLIPPGDASALARAVLDVLADPAMARDLGRGARERAESYDIERVLPQVEQLLERAVTSSVVGAGTYRTGYRRHFRPDARGNPFHRLYARKRQLVLGAAGVPAGQRVADIGGGYGRIAEPLSRLHRVTLCDISEQMLAEARIRCGPEVALVQADARALPFRSDSYDLVVALDLLCHLRDLAPGLRELARVVRPGGRLLVDTTNSRPWWVLAYPRYAGVRPGRALATLRGGGVLPEWSELVRHHRPEEVRRAAADAGLQLRLLGGVGPAGTVKFHVWEATKGEA